MNEEEEKHFSEALYKANANAGHIGEVLSELTRKLMRASVSRDGTQLYNATTDLITLISLIGHSQGLSLGEVIQKAVDELEVTADYQDFDWPMVDLAQEGTRYLLERSSKDGFAAARLSKREERFRRLIEGFKDERRRRVEKLNSINVDSKDNP